MCCLVLVNRDLVNIVDRQQSGVTLLVTNIEKFQVQGYVKKIEENQEWEQKSESEIP